MGIQGLLPLLKPIQRTQHLSEFAGKTIAVDAYVWLHRGIYTCSTELAASLSLSGSPNSTSKTIRTTKYVEFCLARVRLLKYHKINLIVVFDGGNLEAKKGTEKERERKRKENFERAKQLESMGRHKEAREMFAKCVDVTPQMAYQFIKALKSLNIPYIVAPYEADAQLSFLASNNLADAILTEDSDLLVFPSPLVLFKLDIVAGTVISISRSDFGSTAQSRESLSLIGWSDKEFRWMAILSGCDYLPSIPGIGLKTAHTLLRKHKTVPNVLKAIRLEGKKSIPKGYQEMFDTAEKAFLFQRVYDPREQRLVYLSGEDKAEDSGLDDKAEEYIGRDLPPPIAQQIALGEVCPISLEPMMDINPSYQPHVTTPKPLSFSRSASDSSTEGPLKTLNQNTPLVNSSKRVKDKGKEKEKAIMETGGGIMTFFRPKSENDLRARAKAESSSGPNGIKKVQSVKRVIAGRESGKRTLVDVMQDDIAIKKQKCEAQENKWEEAESVREKISCSRFFVSSAKERAPGEADIIDLTSPCSSQQQRPLSSPTPRSNVAVDNSPPPIFGPQRRDLDIDENENMVEQEEGYISPLASPCASPGTLNFLDSPDLSSPEKARGKPTVDNDDYEQDDSEAVSSPVLVRPRTVHGGLVIKPVNSPRISPIIVRRASTGGTIGSTDRTVPDGVVLVLDSPDVSPAKSSSTIKKGPDLSKNFGVEMSSDIECWEVDEASPSMKALATGDALDTSRAAELSTGSLRARSSKSNFTPLRTSLDGDLPDDLYMDEEAMILEAQALARKKVADGWRKRFKCSSGQKSSSFRTPKAIVTSESAPQSEQRQRASICKGRKSDPYPIGERPRRSQVFEGNESTLLARAKVDTGRDPEILLNSRGKLDALRYTR